MIIFCVLCCYLIFNLQQTLEVGVNRCVSEGLSDVEDSNKIKEAERDAKVLKKALEELIDTKSKKAEKLDEILSFHQLVEEVRYSHILSFSII